MMGNRADVDGCVLFISFQFYLEWPVLSQITSADATPSISSLIKIFVMYCRSTPKLPHFGDAASYLRSCYFVCG